MFAAVHEVAGEAAETEREFAAEVEKSAEKDEETSDDEKSTAEFAEGVHESIVPESKVWQPEQTKRDSSAAQAGVRAARTPACSGRNDRVE